MSLTGEPFSPLELTLPEVLDRAPDGEAAVEAGRGVTFAELRERSWAAAYTLAGLDVRSGDRVGLLASNRVDSVAAHYGAARLGAVVVPLSTRASAPELRNVLHHAGVSVAIAEEQFRDLPFRKMLCDLKPDLPELREVVPLDELGATAGDARVVTPELAPTDATMLIYTSGTTGEPKGCLHAHRSYVSSAAITAELKGLTRDDRIIASVPFFNAFGIVNCVLESLWVGASIIIQPAFEPAETLELIERERVTVLLGTPTMWARLIEHPRFGSTDVSSLRTGTMAGAPAPSSLVSRWRELGCEVMLIYGLSEATSILANGRPTPGIEVAIGPDGTLRARGYNHMLGYYRNDAATAERLHDGWLETGDLAELAGDGVVRILGRADDMLIVGGFNVQPAEIEDTLRTHPAILDAAVFGVPHSDLGEVPGAWVIARPGAEPSVDQLTSYCRARVAAYKVPRHIRLVGEFPLTANGKVQRFRMRDEAVGGSGHTASHE